MKQNRCSWPLSSQEMIEYHDREWGRPLFDDTKLYEFFLLDTFQAGLSWAIILSKRNNFKKAFSNFNVAKIAAYGREEQNRLLRNSGIIRNKRKIQAAITNAKIVLDIQKEYGSFAKYLWSFTKGKPIQHSYKRLGDIPTASKEAEAMSKDMRARGFLFVGPTTLYAFMQGIGMVNDHLVSCFAHKEAKKAISRRF
ncbi:DNA-3-methyladenine glycosylase I [Patescibacteria group bacterium]|nr:DNA-3-methyladenine glycosylase I [Patescibacteria group bacterium]